MNPLDLKHYKMRAPGQIAGRAQLGLDSPARGTGQECQLDIEPRFPLFRESFSSSLFDNKSSASTYVLGPFTTSVISLVRYRPALALPACENAGHQRI
jgi:hypothetical protein